jgi:hypothetical protein
VFQTQGFGRGLGQFVCARDRNCTESPWARIHCSL